MRRWIGALAALVMVIAAILVLDPSLTPEWLRGLLGREDGSTGSATPLGLLPTPGAAGPQKVGAQPGAFAPDFSLRSLEGRLWKLSDYREKQKFLINFWASWCGPCKAEMPDLETAYREHREELVVLGIDLQESPEAIRKFLEDFKKDGTTISYPILLDPDGQVKNGYNVFVQPASYFVDEHGRIWGNKYGAFTAAELAQRIDQFLETTSSGHSLQDQGGEPLYQIGDLTGLYFSRYELKSLGLDGDPAQVKYSSSLQRDLLKTQLNPDSIPAIDQPLFEPVEEADSWLKDEDLVVTVVYQGLIKAYPALILNWHKIVNDQLGDLPVAVTFCPLCGSSLVFERPLIEGKRATFGTSGRLYRSDLVMYDRLTGSFWSQIEGRPIVGPLVGRFERLKQIPAELTRWGVWKQAYPQTLVLARPAANVAVPPRLRHAIDLFQRDYTVNPYAEYGKNDYDTFGTPLKDDRLRAKTIVSGLLIGGHAKAYLPEAVARVGLLHDELGGTPVLVLWNSQTQDIVFFSRVLAGQDRPLEFTQQGKNLIDTATQTVWSSDGEALSGSLASQHARLERLIGTTAFWFAWAAFHPEAELYAP